MGPKSEAFARQALIVARQNVAKLSTDMAADLTVVEGDLAALNALRPLPTAEPAPVANLRALCAEIKALLARLFALRTSLKALPARQKEPTRKAPSLANVPKNFVRKARSVASKAKSLVNRAKGMVSTAGKPTEGVWRDCCSSSLAKSLVQRRLFSSHRRRC
jgi:hypothetical protein